MLTRIDFLRNNEPLERLDIILKNPLDYKQQTVSLSIYWKGIGGSEDCWEIGEAALENNQEKVASNAVNLEAQPSTLVGKTRSEQRGFH